MVDNLRLAKQNIEYLKSGLGRVVDKAPAAPEQKPASAAAPEQQPASAAAPEKKSA